MNRHEKLEFLLETCSENFIKDCTVIRSMIDWMGEDDFNEFFDKLCRDWQIMNQEQLNDLLEEDA